MCAALPLASPPPSHPGSRRQDPGNQPFQNLGHTGSLAQIAEAYAKYGQFGLLDVEGVWDAGAAAHNGLTEGWQERLMAVLTPAREFIANGTVKGIVMGDEPCASGVPASAMEEAALFIKAQVGPQAFVYVNGKSLPASPGVHVHWTPRRSTGVARLADQRCRARTENHKPFDPRVRWIPGGCVPGKDSPCSLYVSAAAPSCQAVPRRSGRVELPSSLRWQVASSFEEAQRKRRHRTARLSTRSAGCHAASTSFLSTSVATPSPPTLRPLLLPRKPLR